MQLTEICVYASMEDRLRAMSIESTASAVGPSTAVPCGSAPCPVAASARRAAAYAATLAASGTPSWLAVLYAAG